MDRDPKMKRALILLIGLGFSAIASADSNANAATAAGSANMISNLLLLVAFLFLFYFMLIRPQTKRMKDHQALVSGIAVDDEVVINGGLMGKVTKVTDQFLVVEIADGIQVKVQKQAVSASIPKGTMKTI